MSVDFALGVVGLDMCGICVDLVAVVVGEKNDFWMKMLRIEMMRIWNRICVMVSLM